MGKSSGLEGNIVSTEKGFGAKDIAQFLLVKMRLKGGWGDGSVVRTTD